MAPALSVLPSMRMASSWTRPSALRCEPIAGIEGGIVLQDYDDGFDRVNCGAASGEDFPSGFESALDAGAAIFDGFVGNIPGAAVNDEGGLHLARGVRDLCRAEA